MLNKKLILRLGQGKYKLSLQHTFVQRKYGMFTKC